MKLYTPDNKILIELSVDDTSYRYKEIMGDNQMTLKFSLPHNIVLPLGPYTEYKGERYMLFTPENFVKQHSEHYDYILTIDAYIANTQKKIKKSKLFYNFAR